jgi:hypothetical protein
VWTFDAEVTSKSDLLGPYINGGPGARFIYLSWGTLGEQGFAMFRRAKLMLADIDPAVVAAAEKSGVLVGRLALTDPCGQPVCARVAPPAIAWSAG